MSSRLTRELDVERVLPIEQETKKRKRWAILCDVIKASYNGAKKTHIMYRSNLNPITLEKYLRFCLKHGLIEREEEGYRATIKGSELVRYIEEISSLKTSTEQLVSEAKKLIAKPYERREPT